jgi:hypothetical protein
VTTLNLVYPRPGDQVLGVVVTVMHTLREFLGGSNSALALDVVAFFSVGLTFIRRLYPRH